MKVNEKLVAVLNSILIEKLTTVNQFMAHSEMCENLGYSKLHLAIEKLAMDQMLLAEWLIERISSLGGSATLSKLNSVMIGKTVSAIMSSSNKPDALHAHNDALLLAREVDDETTTDLLTRILKLEKDNTGWAEIQREEIAQKGLENYLITQAESQVN
jgi:bacterioferritin